MSEKGLPDGLSKILENATQVPKAARSAIGLLFPKMRERLGGFFSMNDETTIRIERRISNSDFSPSYFRLEPASQTWGKTEIENIALSLDPATAIKEAHLRINALPKEDRAERQRLLFEQLEEFFESGKAAFSQAWFDTIVWLSPEYIRSYNPSDELLFSFDNITRLRRVMYRGMKQSNEDERARYYRNGVPIAADISLLCSFFRMVSRDLRKDGSSDYDSDVGFGPKENEIRILLLQKIKTFAATGLIWLQAAPDQVLWFWWANGLDGEVWKFTSSQLETPDGQRNLMEFSLGLVRSTGGNYERVPKIVGKILDLDKLKSIAEKSSASGGEQSLIALRFLRGLERSEKGPFGEL